MRIFSKNKKTTIFLLVSFVALLGTLSLYNILESPIIFTKIQAWSSNNMFLLMLLLVMYKTVSALWPPLSSGMISIAFIPFIGWLPAYVCDLLGSLIGGTITYILGQKYGFKILSMVLEPNIVGKISQLKVNPKKEIEGIYILRILLGTTILEAIGYCAGLFKVKYSNFLIGWGLAHITLTLPSFYLIHLSLAFFGVGSKGLLIGLLPLLIFVLIVKRLKKRYFLPTT